MNISNMPRTRYVYLFLLISIFLLLHSISLIDRHHRRIRLSKKPILNLKNLETLVSESKIKKQQSGATNFNDIQTDPELEKTFNFIEPSIGSTPDFFIPYSKKYFKKYYHRVETENNRNFNRFKCLEKFPKLYSELQRSKKYFDDNKIKVSTDDLDEAIKFGHARVMIYENQVFIKQFNGGPGKRTEAILNSIQEAVITSPGRLPNVEFVISTEDVPKESSKEHMLWTLDRSSSQNKFWLMPDFGFYSWPEPRVGSMNEVRATTLRMENTIKEWKNKISKAFWKGALLVQLRKDLIEVSKGRSWSDISEIVWNRDLKQDQLKRPDEHCYYKYLIHVEGYAYSGRLKYLLMCRSVIITHKLKYIQHFHHLFDSNSSSIDQNIIVLNNPGFKDLNSLMNKLTKSVKDEDGLLDESKEGEDFTVYENKTKVESIANNSVKLFRYYLSPAAINCYWRQMIYDWYEVQDFEPKYNFIKDTSFESFNLMHLTSWDPY
ncbi:glycosyl transferase family 90-domain-containing protein [Phakopsora pachyrhizi]|uniref:Glycosyl transferase family 90-domain-containing protein n=1 Tax=Phakopsora pachyrhizi TaxID=170000 RepID=A0AAV0BM74_PHAPC|nr:glycosyl transferase family 90-domain-containing protein [Phakopsora pachyrhizi]